MESGKTYSVIYRTLRVLLRPFLKIKYSFTTDYVQEPDEPYLLLSNHTTEDDMFFTGLASPRPMYFVCGEHLLRNPIYGKLLRTLADPIPVPKGGASLQAVKDILRRLRAGQSICMFPEGKRSFHGETIPCGTATGKLVKKAGCALVTYRISGGYFTRPRWAGKHCRRGHVEGKVMGVYSSEQLQAMTPQEITELINRDIFENAYELQRRNRWRYRGRNLTAGMEHVLFLCPHCRTMDSLRTEGNSFTCTACGMYGVYNEYGFIEGENLPFDNVHDWMRWIEPEFDNYARSRATDESVSHEPNVRLYRMLEGFRNEDLLIGDLTVYADRLLLRDGGDAGSTREFRFADISAASILYGNILLFTHGGTYYGITGEAFHAWKCARLWHLTVGDTDDPSKEI